MRRALFTAIVLTLAVSPGHAQSLGDAAAREKAKRQKKGPSGAPVITDAELKASRPPGQKEPDPSTGSSPASTGRERSGPTSSERPGGGEGSSGDGNEKLWRERAQSHRSAIAAAEKAIQDGQDRLNRLMADLEPVGLGDPNRLQTIERMKGETRQAIDRAQLQRAEAQKALQDLEEEARRNNVPPGWLR